ncbi:hypothetical protein MKW98_022209 [Papaver atlanticum]|uniref:Knl1 C-terminal RWD domain-containing protein n=1 Tax=Papaver atlanticum TaxID=357466 RepID=A0AAD4T3V2_9MAGN|nr:hypothetical protein MKW98_022209 [Papaver atlanticum]
MDNRDREDLCNSAPDEETIARDKKRLRRVSFAELTEVFHFDKDDDSDQASTDPKPSPQNSELKVGLGFLKNFDDSDDSKELSRYEDEYDEEDDEQKGFLQRMDSSSPGSCFGSATSNDDDDFFGAVSSSFIRSGLSDSAVSNDDDELTLDARTFTEQFRHLLPPNSEGNYKTPTRTPLTFDGKTTPTGSTIGTNPGSFMALTGLDKLSPAASVSGGKSSGSGGDMSLVEENPCMYDYGRLSPTLEANIAEGSGMVNDMFISYQVNISKPSNFVSVDNELKTSDELDSWLMLKDTEAMELENSDIHHPPSKLVSEVNDRPSEEKGGATSVIGHISTGTAHNILAIASGNAHHSHEPTSATNMPSATGTDCATNVLKVVGGSNSEVDRCSHHPLTPLSEKNQIDRTVPDDHGDVDHVEHRTTEDSFNNARYTPESGFKTNQSSKLEESISSLTAKRRQIFPQTNVISKSHEPTSATNLLSAMDAVSARDAQKVVGGSDFEFGGDSPHPLTSQIETNKIDMAMQSDRGDVGPVEHRMTENFSNNAKYTPESGSKTDQSSKLEESISSLNAKLGEVFPATNVLSKSGPSLYLVEDRMNEDSFGGARCTPDICIKTNQSSKSSQEGSVSLLSAERRHIFLPTIVLSRGESIVTPSSGVQPRSPSNDGNVRDSARISSRDFNSLNLKTQRALLADMEVESSSDPVLVETTGDDKSKAPCMMHSRENLSSVPQEDKEVRATTGMGINVVGTPGTIRNLGEKEDIVGMVQNGVLRDQISTGISSNDLQSKLPAAAVMDPLTCTLSKDKLNRNSSFHKPSTHDLTDFVSESSQRIRFEVKDKNHESEQMNSSPLKLLSQKLSEHEQLPDLADQGAVLASMSHLSPQLAVEPVKGGSLLTVNFACDPALAQHDDNLSFIINDNETHTLSKSKLVSSAGLLRHGMQKETEIVTSLVTPLRYVSTLNPQSGSPESNFRSRTEPDRLKVKVPEKISSYGPASTCVRKRTATPTRLDKRLMEWLPQCQSTKETNISSENVGGRKDPGSPKSLSIQDAEHSGQKRRIEQTSFVDNGNVEPVRIQKSPKVAPELEGMMFCAKHCIEKNNEAERDGDNALPRDWDYIFSNFSKAMKQQLLPLADNLTLKEVCILEDVLGRLEKANKYKVLCNEIKSQKIHNLDINFRQKRVAEARYLQQMLVYKQAKLQLLHLRQDRSHKKFQSLHSAIKETQILSKSFSNLSKRDAGGVPHDESHKPSFYDDQNRKSRDEHDEVTAKRQELGALNKKVKDLTQALISSCKITMEPSSNHVVELVNDHLKRKTASRFVRQDLQLWEVVGLERKTSQYDLLLNYRDFLHQRFSINVGPSSSIVATIKLIDVNILKSFTNINACVAFTFVFNAMRSRNLGSGKNLAFETQLTSLLLSNLLDVVEEAYMIHIELNNLIKTSFHSPTVDQLDLQLQFIDFKTGCKVTLTLDMTSLQRGVYPSEILPSQFQTNSPVSQLPSAEILSEVGALQAGHSRIIRLCRCVSHVLKARNI